MKAPILLTRRSFIRGSAWFTAATGLDTDQTTSFDEPVFATHNPSRHEEVLRSTGAPSRGGILDV